MACSICKKRFVLPSDGPSTYDSDEKPHVCGTCGKSFSLKVQLKKHMEAHQNGKQFVCISCEKDNSLFNDAGSSEKGIFSCEKCDGTFESKRLLLQHTSSQHSASPSDSQEPILNESESKEHSPVLKSCQSKKIKPHQCKHCDQSFAELHALNRHYISHKKYECIFCHAKFFLKQDLEFHRQMINCVKKKPDLEESKHEKNYACLICQKTFTRKSSLDGHILTHVNRLESAEEESSDKDSLSKKRIEKCSQKSGRLRKKAEENNGTILAKKKCLPKLKLSRPYPCNSCSNSFATESLLEKHKLTHKKKKKESVHQTKKKYRCRICRELLLSRDDYKQHKSTHGSEDKPMKRIKTYLCEVCLTSFEKKKLWKKHLKTHKSKICSKKSKTGSNSKKNKTFPCEICGKHLARESTLKKHVLNCTTPKKNLPAEALTCPFCKADFTGRKVCFMRHKLSHTPEVCGICDERFVDRDGLREHLKTHIGTDEARTFLECSNKAQALKNNSKPGQPDPKVEYIYLVLR